jgi:AmmeMemoRadiSam system protein B
VSQLLPRLRLELDFMPSPVEDRPGLLIRDPYKFSDTTLIVPPPLVQCLELFDGEHTDLDLREMLVRITGDLNVGDLEQNLVGALDGAGFLRNDAFEQMREARLREFTGMGTREPTHAGSAYPGEISELRMTLDNYMNGATAADSDGLIGIAAPHVSPFGGWESYRAAYGVLAPRYRDRTFVILGTSHYGEPDRFGLTRKEFVTPYGRAATDLAMVNELESKAPAAVRMEDYCHAVEHSIEFQVVFLQHLFGPEIRIVPILCGSYATSIYVTGEPEDNAGVAAFLDALGEIAARESRRLMFVLGIDMAHIGRRYGDRFEAVADQAEMIGVAERDRARIDRIQAGDARGFWELVKQNRDDLKWCGSAPLYTFLKAVPNARGELLRYQQWNIDPQSVVSFAGMRFTH